VSRRRRKLAAGDRGYAGIRYRTSGDGCGRTTVGQRDELGAQEDYTIYPSSAVIM